MRLALYQPEIPQNTGTLLRLGACLGVPLDIIEPCGFVLTDQRLKRSGMDYLEMANFNRHDSWHAFLASKEGRLVLLKPHTNTSFLEFSFEPNDILLLGQESVGVPEEVFHATDAQVKIPMLAGRRSINVALAASMVLGEALRQTNGYPTP